MARVDSLQSNSPAIDAGTATGSPEFDWNDIARPQGDGFAMGAHEYTDEPAEPKGLKVKK
jgi:hypothetical protein